RVAAASHAANDGSSLPNMKPAIKYATKRAMFMRCNAKRERYILRLSGQKPQRQPQQQQAKQQGQNSENYELGRIHCKAISNKERCVAALTRPQDLQHTVRYTELNPDRF